MYSGVERSGSFQRGTPTWTEPSISKHDVLRPGDGRLNLKAPLLPSKDCPKEGIALQICDSGSLSAILNPKA